MKGVWLLGLALALTACGAVDEGAHDLAGAPASLVCGWTLNRTEQLAELPTDQCWKIAPGADLATMPPGFEPCGVSAGTRLYAGGAFIDLWRGIAWRGVTDFDQVQVDCPMGKGTR